MDGEIRSTMAIGQSFGASSLQGNRRFLYTLLLSVLGHIICFQFLFSENLRTLSESKNSPILSIYLKPPSPLPASPSPIKQSLAITPPLPNPPTSIRPTKNPSKQVKGTHSALNLNMPENDTKTPGTEHLTDLRFQERLDRQIEIDHWTKQAALLKEQRLGLSDDDYANAYPGEYKVDGTCYRRTGGQDDTKTSFATPCKDKRKSAFERIHLAEEVFKRY